ncbi:Myosin light chain kinase, smooth muscle [Frankliniella fusca]|uniref:Myosin light chain kinase, smooth muscle n=1 Tax=Frankliniella fusca TaxID=407009 RepID=A0AAE1L759_9NEOP|nr:Myosin light chain kinase, smooth muscle [Frankliniella fusca]
MPRNPRKRSGRKKGYRKQIGALRKGKRQYRVSKQNNLEENEVEGEGFLYDECGEDVFGEDSEVEEKLNVTRSLQFSGGVSNEVYENFHGFSDYSCGNFSEFCGFSNEDIACALITMRKHVLHGFASDIEFMGQPGTVCFMGDTTMFPNGHCMSLSMHVHSIIPRKARVLSVFDGIGTAHVVLPFRLQLDPDVFYSSEICPKTLLVLTNNLYGQIVPVGDVRSLSSVLNSLGRIDFLCGDPPCNDVANVNTRLKKGLQTSRGRPAGSADPVGPAGSADPVGPAGSADPVGPAGPAGSADPVRPAGPAGSADPVRPAGPDGSADPVGPAGPAGSADPVGPAGPAGSADRVVYAGRIYPVRPAGPAGPVLPAANPADPAGPAGSADPVGSAGPAGRTSPARPAGPAGPVLPANPAGPASPAGLAAGPLQLEGLIKKLVRRGGRAGPLPVPLEPERAEAALQDTDLGPRPPRPCSSPNLHRKVEDELS